MGKEVIFPGLNLKFNVSRIAITIGKIELYWYAVLITLAFIIALIILKIRDKKLGVNFEEVLNLAIFLIPISIVCARLYYVVFNLNYYLNNIDQIFNIRNGGLAIYGGVIGGIITCYIFCKKRKINILDLLDYIAPVMALGQSIGRWGNFINVEAYGTETTLPWRMGIIEAGKYIEVHPTFLYESVSTFTIFIILSIISKKRKFKGQITYLYLIMYSFARAIIESLRIDSLKIGDIRVSRSFVYYNIYNFNNYVYCKFQ